MSIYFARNKVIGQSIVRPPFHSTPYINTGNLIEFGKRPRGQYQQHLKTQIGNKTNPNNGEANNFYQELQNTI